ncbi:hypothetical protein ACFPOG_12740 [Paenibacillus aestuarii]|uniref:Uncharacterized protein n=1 Tax=Paenibacillus aestuarii TaxID=516965 RepID=A0ABW0K8V5_9BACL
MNMKSSSSNQDLANELGKEFWGILSFEMCLPSLYHLLDGNEMGIGLKRFSDWILFPEKIPDEFQPKLCSSLEERRNDEHYQHLQDRQMTVQEERAHNLILELLRLKYLGASIDPDHLHHIYQLPENVFFALSIQYVERGYLSSQKLMEIYPRFVAAKGE